MSVSAEQTDTNINFLDHMLNKFIQKRIIEFNLLLIVFKMNKKFMAQESAGKVLRKHDMDIHPTERSIFSE